MKALVVASGFPTQYRVVRAVADTLGKPIVVGTGTANRLKQSRFCDRYIDGGAGFLEDEDATISLIDRIGREHGVGLVVPSDAQTTRFLGAHCGRIEAPCFPTPDADSFDALNDKWAFYQLCLSLGIPTPKTHYFDTASDLQAAVAAGTIQLPGVVKPHNMYGSFGVRVVHRADEIASVTYAPVLYQEFVPGEDWDMSALARNGDVTDWCVYQRRKGRFFYLESEPYLSGVSRIIKHLNLSGVYNFDARVDGTGQLYMIECNPRFFNTMDYSQVAGMNFFAQALADSPVDRPSIVGQSVRTPKRTLLDGLRPWRLEKNDLRMLLYRLRDPWPMLLSRNVSA